VEVLLQVDSAVKTVVEEESDDVGPDVVGGGAGVVHSIHEGLGDGGVQPRDDAGVDLEPLGIVLHEDGVEGAVDVAGEGELLESEFEERTPLQEVGLVHVEGDRDMAVDVENGNGQQKVEHQGRGRQTDWRSAQRS